MTCLSCTSSFILVHISVQWPNPSLFKGNPPQIRNIPISVSTQYLLAPLNLLACASKYKLDNKPKVYLANPKWRRQFHCGSYYHPNERNQERGAKPQALRGHLSTHPVGIPNHLHGQVGRTRSDRKQGTGTFPYCPRAGQHSPASARQKGVCPCLLTQSKGRETDSSNICMWQHHIYSKAGLGPAKTWWHITEEMGF